MNLKLGVLIFCLLFVQFLINGGLLAQNSKQIFCKIVNSSNHQAISFASVKFLKSNKYITSNSNGEFQISASNLNDSIEISNIGFSTQRFAIKSDIDTLIFKLETQFIDINEIVVTATRTEKMLKDVPVLTQIISSNQIQNSCLTNVSEILNSVKPCVDFYNEGRGMTFRTQGLAAKYTLFLIDGERIAGENRDNIDYSRLTSSNIERIEIVQGASSSLYGSNAIGGVVNLITKTPVKPFETSIYSRFSKFNELENGLNVGFKIKKFTFFTDVVRKRSDGYDNSPETADLYTVEPFEVFSNFNKIIFDVNEKIQLSARLTYFTREKFEVSQIPKHPFYTDLSTGFNAKIKYSEKLHFEASIFRDNYNTFDVFEKRNDSLGTVYENVQLSSKFISDYQIHSKNNKLNQHITAGFEYLYDKVYTKLITDSLRKNENYMIFIQDEINFKKLNITVGTRTNFNSEYGNSTSPKISFMYKYKKLKYRLSIAKGFKVPTIKERFYDFENDFVKIIGNENLIPEKSFYKSFSVEYLASKSNFSLNFYNNFLKDMIYEDPIPNVYNGFTYKNFNNVSISGFDLLTRTKILKNFSITSGYSFTYAYDLDSNKLMVGVSKHSATIGFDYFKNWKSNVIGFAFNGKIYGEKEFYNRDNGLIIIDFFPTYSLWKLSIINKFLNQALILNFGVDNIFNYKTVGDLVNIDPGRRLFVSVNISCDKLYKQIKK